MTGIELQAFGVGNDRCANCATTDAANFSSISFSLILTFPISDVICRRSNSLFRELSLAISSRIFDRRKDGQRQRQQRQIRKVPPEYTNCKGEGSIQSQSLV